MKPIVLIVVSLALTSALLTAGCQTNMTESRKFVIATDSLNTSMMTVNRLYDQEVISPSDYKAAAVLFFEAVDYVLAWNDALADGRGKPDMRIKIIQMAQQLAVLALESQERNDGQ